MYILREGPASTPSGKFPEPLVARDKIIAFAYILKL